MTALIQAFRTLAAPAAPQAKTGTWGRHVAAMFLAALLVRLAALLIPHAIPVGDNALDIYLPSAQRILDGLGFNDATTREFSAVGPGYSYLLAGLFAVFGQNLFVARAAQALMDAGTAVFVFLLAERLACRRTAVAAFIGYALYPLAIHYTQQINSESLFTFAQAGALWVLCEALRRREARWFVLAGILFGLTALIRSSALVLALALVPIVALTPREKLRGLAHAAALTAVALALVLTWGIRNHRVLGDFILLQTNSGSTFCHGADERTWTLAGRVAYHEPIVRSLEPRGILKPTSGRESEIDRWYWKAGIELYRIMWEQSPVSVGIFFLKKCLRVWYATEVGHSGPILGLIHFPLLGLMLCGIMARRRAIKVLDLALLITIGLYVAIDVLTLPMIRYLAPVMPYIIIYASVGVLWIASRVMPVSPQPEPSP
jgi:4-amino-4-deoxy-L-arabinose transferase-like glycosyltransferase